MRGPARPNSRPSSTEPPNPFLIGPGIDSRRAGTSRDAPSDLLEDARQKVRCDNEEEEQTIALTRRLVVAFVLIILIGAIFFVLMPYYGMNLHPIMPIMVFIAIAAGAILTAPTPPKKNSCETDQDGRPIGCCQGPRPLRMFRDQD